MLVEITKVVLDEAAGEIVIEGISLEGKFTPKNWFAEVKPKKVVYRFYDELGFNRLDEITDKMFQCKDKGAFGNKVKAMVGARTILLPDRYLDKGLPFPEPQENKKKKGTP